MLPEGFITTSSIQYKTQEAIHLIPCTSTKWKQPSLYIQSIVTGHNTVSSELITLSAFRFLKISLTLVTFHEFWVQQNIPMQASQPTVTHCPYPQPHIHFECRTVCKQSLPRKWVNAAPLPFGSSLHQNATPAYCLCPLSFCLTKLMGCRQLTRLFQLPSGSPHTQKKRLFQGQYI